VHSAGLGHWMCLFGVATRTVWLATRLPFVRTQLLMLSTTASEAFTATRCCGVLKVGGIGSPGRTLELSGDPSRATARCWVRAECGEIKASVQPGASAAIGGNRKRAPNGRFNQLAAVGFQGRFRICFEDVSNRV